MGVYSAGKAARDMLHAVIAQECSAALDVVVKTLSYAPGPMDTEMQAQMRASDTIDAGTRAFFQKMHAENTFVDCAASAAKCAHILEANRFASGAHIDFYDANP